MSRPRVILVGLGPTAESALESLLETCDVVAVVRPAGGNGVDPVMAQATRAGIQVVNDVAPAAIAELTGEQRPDAVVVSSYDRILKGELLERTLFINVHYSPLPQYRGRANVNWAVVNQEPCAAISIHRLEAGLDAGNILFQQLIPIGARETVTELYARLNELQRRHLGETVARAVGGFAGVAQDEAGATYGCTRLPEDGEIDWSSSTRAIDALIRALTPPFPGALTYLDGAPLRVRRAEPVNQPVMFAGRVPGRVIARSAATGSVDVLTGDGVLRIHEVQPRGESGPVAAAHWIRSVKKTLGLRPADLLTRVEILEERLRDLESRASTESKEGIKT